MDGAEKSELVEGGGLSMVVVEEKIGVGANVCGENVRSLMRLAFAGKIVNLPAWLMTLTCGVPNAYLKT